MPNNDDDDDVTSDVAGALNKIKTRRVVALIKRSAQQHVWLPQ